MKVRSIENRTDKLIATDVVENGLWAGFMYLYVNDGLMVPDEEVNRLRSAGAVVVAWDDNSTPGNTA